MSFRFGPEVTSITIRAEFPDVPGGGHVSFTASHPALLVDDHGDGSATLRPAEPTVATDVQVFGVWTAADNVEQRTTAPFGVQLGAEHGGYLEVTGVEQKPAPAPVPPSDHSLPEAGAEGGVSTPAASPSVSLPEPAVAETGVEPAAPPASEPATAETWPEPATPAEQPGLE